MLEQVVLTAQDDVAEWRAAARRLLIGRVAPDAVTWQVGSAQADLFGSGLASAPGTAPDAAPIDPAMGAGGVRAPRVPRAFLALADQALLHSAADRHALLYALLWRLQAHPRLLDDASDSQLRRAHLLAREVRRDMHKMRAFVRFRVVEDGGGPQRYVAWFEPQHHILRANAGFFVRRFAAMRWAILTPDLSVHWDGKQLTETPGARREDAPQDDAAEALWKDYYAAIFNPARLKVQAMCKEMPQRYWKNMPEAALIPQLIAGAQARSAAMVAAGRGADAPPPADMAALRAEVAACTRCPIHCAATQAVCGEGPEDARLMIVGEQPGDKEDLAGRPFVGPAGQLLDELLGTAGIDRGASYLTNAVKHFKHEQRGKMRLHATPSAGEIDHCRWWLDAERAIVRPRLVLALGASAARGILGRTVSLNRERGAWRALGDGSQLLITTHPSYLLRLPDAARPAAREAMLRDLETVRAELAALGHRRFASPDAIPTEIHVHTNA